jgi:4-diphosphocytidyl-2-C-methyl-D-erythritol kinase
VTTLVALAPAKINVGLEVIRRRDDDYHEVVTVMQAISLFDRFIWSPTCDSFSYSSPESIDSGDDLVRRALDRTSLIPRLRGRLKLEKSIPMAAGLGGGSSDAALALTIAYPDAETKTLHRLAEELGSDVPFFLTGGTALASETGTKLHPLPDQHAWFVVVTPAIRIADKTRTFFQSLNAEDFSDGQRVLGIAARLQAGQSIESSPPNAFTRLLMAFPEVSSAWFALEHAGAPWISISGAGPSVYTLVQTYAEARAVHSRLSGKQRSFVARALPANVNRNTAARISAVMVEPGSSR